MKLNPVSKGNLNLDYIILNKKNVLQLSVPITMNTGLETKVIGAVLISASMESIYSDIENLKKRHIKNLFLCTNNIYSIDSYCN